MTHLTLIFERSPELTARLTARVAQGDTPEDVRQAMEHDKANWQEDTCHAQRKPNV